MNIMVTGHRPNGMPTGYGYNIDNKTWFNLKEVFKKIIMKYADYKDVTLISGMALGVDQAFWMTANELRNESPDTYKIEAAVPFKGQESKWFNKSIQDYKMMIDNSDIVTIVSDGGYSAAKLELRNRYMVDKADVVIGVCCKNTGGTVNCLKYAKSKHKEIYIINPETLETRFYDFKER